MRDLLSKPSPWPTWPLLSHRVRSYLSQVRAKVDMITMLASESKHRKKNCNQCKRTENKDRSKVVIIVILAARCSREEQSELGRS